MSGMGEGDCSGVVWKSRLDSESKQVLPRCGRMTTKKQKRRAKAKCGGHSTARWTMKLSMAPVEMTILEVASRKLGRG
jgi:hypothetical protein